VSNTNNEKVMLFICVCSCRFPVWSTSSVRFKMDEISPVLNQLRAPRMDSCRTAVHLNAQLQTVTFIKHSSPG
jgi:hypothetical protein